MRISKESRRIIEIKLRCYPDNKRKYEEYISDILGASGNSPAIYDDNKPQSVTEAKALKMHSAYYDHMKNEIMAVEYVYDSLSDEEKKVMKERYWKNKNKNTPYVDMNVSYSERQCIRIINKIVFMAGKMMLEIQ